MKCDVLLLLTTVDLGLAQGSWSKLCADCSACSKSDQHVFQVATGIVNFA